MVCLHFLFRFLRSMNGTQLEIGRNSTECHFYGFRQQQQKTLIGFLFWIHLLRLAALPLYIFLSFLLLLVVFLFFSYSHLIYTNLKICNRWASVRFFFVRCIRLTFRSECVSNREKNRSHTFCGLTPMQMLRHYYCRLNTRYKANPKQKTTTGKKVLREGKRGKQEKRKMEQLSAESCKEMNYFVIRDSLEPEISICTTRS